MRRAVLALLLPLLLPSGAPGLELTGGIWVRPGYTDNVGNLPVNTKDDAFFEGRPWIRLRHDQGRLRYEVSYRPRYEAYLAVNGANGWDHRVEGSWTYFLDGRTSVFGGGRFARDETLIAQEERLTTFPEDELAEAPGREDTVISFSRDRRKAWNARIGIQRVFGPRATGSLMFQHVFAGENDRRTLIEQKVDSAVAAVDLILGGRDSLQVSLSASQTRQGVKTNRYTPLATWTHDFGGGLEIALGAGPQVVDPERIDRDRAAPGVARLPFVIRQPGNLVQLIQSRCFSSFRGLSVIGPFTRADLEAFQAGGGMDPALIGSNVTTACRDTLNNITLDAGPLLAGNLRDEVEALHVDALMLHQNPASEITLEPVVNLDITKTWDEIEWTVRLSRTERGSQVFGSSVEQEQIETRLVWRPNPLWRIVVSGAARRVEAESEGVATGGGFLLAVADAPLALAELGLGPGATGPVAQVSGILFDKVRSRAEDQTYRVGLLVRRRVSRQLSVFLQAVYRKKRSRRESSSAFAGTFLDTFTRTETIRAGLGMEYQFGPYRVW